MNAIDQIRNSLGIKDDIATLVTVVAVVGNNTVEAHGNLGLVINLSGNWAVGTNLIVKSGVVQSVVVNSGVVIYSD